MRATEDENMDEDLSFGKKTWTSLSLTNRRQT